MLRVLAKQSVPGYMREKTSKWSSQSGAVEDPKTNCTFRPLGISYARAPDFARAIRCFVQCGDRHVV